MKTILEVVGFENGGMNAKISGDRASVVAAISLVYSALKDHWGNEAKNIINTAIEIEDERMGNEE